MPLGLLVCQMDHVSITEDNFICRDSPYTGSILSGFNSSRLIILCIMSPMIKHIYMYMN